MAARSRRLILTLEPSDTRGAAGRDVSFAAVTAPALVSAPAAPAATRDLRALLPDELTALIKAAGEPAYRTEQIFRWLHGQGVESLEAMTNVPAELRAALERDHQLTPLAQELVQTAHDGTRKLRFRTHDGRAIESVLIPDEDAARNKLTLCISSQVGCAIDCQFCATATLGFGRHLGAGEIVSQVYRATALAGRRPTNLVFMGMGEPLHNFDNVVRARWRCSSTPGAPVSRRGGSRCRRRVWCPGSRSSARSSPPPTWRSRSTRPPTRCATRIMPINKKWPIAALLDAARRFPLSHGRRVTFEYVLLAGVNDSDADADRLPRLLRGIPAKVNLIPWNPFQGPAFQRPSAERIRTFQERLRTSEISVYIRSPRGDDIDAACGQLAARELVQLRA